MSTIKFCTGTSEDYFTLENKDEDTLYFIKDEETATICKGETLFLGGGSR